MIATEDTNQSNASFVYFTITGQNLQNTKYIVVPDGTGLLKEPPEGEPTAGQVKAKFDRQALANAVQGLAAPEGLQDKTEGQGAGAGGQFLTKTVYVTDDPKPNKDSQKQGPADLTFRHPV